MDKNEKDIKSEVSALQFVDQGIYQSALQYAHWNAERDAFEGLEFLVLTHFLILITDIEIMKNLTQA